MLRSRHENGHKIRVGPNSDCNIKVAVRVRPVFETETVQDNLITVLGDQELSLRPDHNASRYQGTRNFVFDKCFTHDQSVIYSDFGQDFVNHAFEGYNACVLAYGQTGSGKSYTMLGDTENPGLIPRTCEDIFTRISKLVDSGAATSITVRLSVYEVYNEQIRDLLVENSTAPLRVRDCHHELPQSAYVEGLSEFTVKSVKQVLRLIDHSRKTRATAATKMNSYSSRSHAIFAFQIKQIIGFGVTTEEKISHLKLVDLAGSERADTSGSCGERLREGSNINKSLVTLGRVIAILADKPPRSVVVPYRDSILTRLLRDSLGGNSKTAMIACISPTNYEQTLSTLRYANQATKICTAARINLGIIPIGDQSVRLEALERDLNELQQKLAQQESASADLARITAAVRFYEEQAAIEESRRRAIEAQNAVLLNQNFRLEEYIREVANRGISRVDSCNIPLECIEQEYQLLQRDLVSERAHIKENLLKWRVVMQEI